MCSWPVRQPYTAVIAQLPADQTDPTADSLSYDTNHTQPTIINISTTFQAIMPASPQAQPHGD